LEGPDRGWEFLLASSKNFAAAKLLALRSPECDAHWPDTVPLTPELGAAATHIAWDYLEGATSALKPLSDPDRLSVGVRQSKNVHVSETKECGYWGNKRLAFVPMVFSYESDAAIGQIDLLLILRKQATEWRLLIASTDPISLGKFSGKFPLQLPRLTRLMNSNGIGSGRPLPATFLTPDDGEIPQPVEGQRFGEFTWRSSESTDVIAEIIEFSYNDDARLFLRFPSSNPADSRISSGNLWSNTLWKWRVWSVTATGELSFSDTRTFAN
jgi:hypothetical protein